MSDLAPFQVEVLRVLAGEEVPGFVWGAAVTEAAESLKEAGLAAGRYHITAEGRATLRRHKECEA